MPVQTYSGCPCCGGSPPGDPCCPTTKADLVGVSSGVINLPCWPDGTTVNFTYQTGLVDGSGATINGWVAPGPTCKGDPTRLILKCASGGTTCDSLGMSFECFTGGAWVEVSISVDVRHRHADRAIGISIDSGERTVGIGGVDVVRRESLVAVVRVPRDPVVVE